MILNFLGTYIKMICDHKVAYPQGPGSDNITGMETPQPYSF